MPSSVVLDHPPWCHAQEEEARAAAMVKDTEADVRARSLAQTAADARELSIKEQTVSHVTCFPLCWVLLLVLRVSGMYVCRGPGGGGCKLWKVGNYCLSSTAISPHVCIHLPRNRTDHAPMHARTRMHAHTLHMTHDTPPVCSFGDRSAVASRSRPLSRRCASSGSGSTDRTWQAHQGSSLFCLLRC